MPRKVPKNSYELVDNWCPYCEVPFAREICPKCKMELGYSFPISRKRKPIDFDITTKETAYIRKLKI